LAEVLPVFHPEEKNGARKFVATTGLDVRLNQSGGDLIKPLSGSQSGHTAKKKYSAELRT
jgi:hypothetical protein